MGGRFLLTLALLSALLCRCQVSVARRPPTGPAGGSGEGHRLLPGAQGPLRGLTAAVLGRLTAPGCSS